jgi:hypothetical protein
MINAYRLADLFAIAKVITQTIVVPGKNSRCRRRNECKNGYGLHDLLNLVQNVTGKNRLGNALQVYSEWRTMRILDIVSSTPALETKKMELPKETRQRILAFTITIRLRQFMPGLFRSR